MRRAKTARRSCFLCVFHAVLVMRMLRAHTGACRHYLNLCLELSIMVTKANTARAQQAEAERLARIDAVHRELGTGPYAKSTKFTSKAKPSVVIDNETGAEVKGKPSDAWSRFQQAQDDLLRDLGAPSKVRVVVAYVVGFIASFATGYLVGTLVELVMLGALALTGSAFLALMIYIVGLVIAIYAGMHAFSQGFGYVVSDTCTSHVETIKGLKNTVVGWFTRNPEPVAS